MLNEKLPPIVGSYKRKHKIVGMANVVPTKNKAHREQPPTPKQPTALKQHQKLKERRLSKDGSLGVDGNWGLSEMEYPTMVASNTDVQRIDVIKNLEVEGFTTLFVFQAADLNSEIRINNINVLCNRFRIIGNLSYVIKKRICGGYTATVSTFTIESAVNSNGFSVFLTVAPCVLLKIISIISDQNVNILSIDGVETFSENLVLV